MSERAETGDDETAPPDNAREEEATVSERPPPAAQRTPIETDSAERLRAIGSGTSARSLADGTAAAHLSMSGRSIAPSGTAVGSPLEALHRAEILGTRTFCRVGFLIALAAVVSVVVLPGNRIASMILVAAIVAASCGLGYLYHRTNDPATYYDGHGVAIGWYIPALAVCGAVPFFGPFSPVPVILVLGIYFTSSGRSARLAFTIYLTCALTQAVTGTLVVLGLVDPGFVVVDSMPLVVQILCQLLVQVVLIGTFLIARAQRRSSLTALGELERAVRAIAQREAVLEEAREELRRAVGTGRGRFTDQLIGRFRLADVIGRGAMGEVYEANDTATNELVAVKMLAQTSLGDPQHVQRFLRELRTAVAIESPNVVRVIEVGETPLPYLAMERLRGRDLATILRGKRPLAHDKVIDMLRQVGAGITAAGKLGVVHRDLKPQNIFLSGATWKVLDFGVARLQDASDTLTAGHVVGTPAYMAPEQARSATVTHRTDLYALAAIAYRVLTGHAPFSGGEVVDVLYRVVHSKPKRPTLLANVGDDVDLVLAIGLAKDPDARFASAGELADALEAALASKLDDTSRARGRALANAWAPSIPLVRPTS